MPSSCAFVPSRNIERIQQGRMPFAAFTLLGMVPRTGPFDGGRTSSASPDLAHGVPAVLLYHSHPVSAGIVANPRIGRPNIALQSWIPAPQAANTMRSFNSEAALKSRNCQYPLLLLSEVRDSVSATTIHDRQNARSALQTTARDTIDQRDGAGNLPSLRPIKHAIVI